MICLHCGHYVNPDREMEVFQNSGSCHCGCHPWNTPNRTEVAVSVMYNKLHSIIQDACLSAIEVSGNAGRSFVPDFIVNPAVKKILEQLKGEAK